MDLWRCGRIRCLHLIRIASCKTYSLQWFRVLGASFSRFWGLRFRSRVLRFRSWVLRFRVLGASFSSLGCFVFEFGVLRASVFVFECFVFETTRCGSFATRCGPCGAYFFPTFSEETFNYLIFSMSRHDLISLLSVA